MGVLLGVPKGNLDSIEHDNRHSVENCCDQMLERWLGIDNGTSWAKVYNVIDSQAVSGDQALIIKGEYLQYS